MVSRSEIKPQVYGVIAAVSNAPVGSINDSKKLRQDLLLGEAMIAALAVPWTRISKSYQDGLPVSMKESKATKLVSDCVDLVTARANGQQ